MSNLDKNNHSKSSLLNQAIYYREKLGWSIIPVGKDKKPLVEWKKYQSVKASVEEIKNWWATNPEANIGVVTGKISNLIVVDIDPRNGGDNKEFNRVITVTAKTGGGGWHYYCQYDPAITSSKLIEKGVDIQSDGKYVIVPSSIHQLGNRYEWIMSPHAGTPIISLPSFVKEWLAKAKNSGSNWNPEVLKGVERGRRNNSATSITGKLMVEITPDKWSELVFPYLELWNKNLREPLPEIELKTIYNSIAEKELLRRQNDQGSTTNNSFPPSQTQGLPVAKKNIPPKIQTWQEFINQDTAEEPWLIEGILRPGWLAVLGGHGKHGKSTLAFHVLNAFRSGGNFINLCQRVPVCYLNCEMAEADTRGILKAIMNNSSSMEGENALIIGNIQLPLKLEWLNKLLLDQPKPGVCVIDSFRGAFMLAGETENQAGVVGNLLRSIQNIARKTKWSIIVIHHFRKSGTGVPLDLAGSGEWLSAPDVILTWHCPKPKEPGTLTIVGRISPLEPLSIRLSRDKIEFLGTTSEQSAEAERLKILDFLSEEVKESKDIAKAVEIPEGTARRRLEEMYKRGEVNREGEGKKGNPYLWSKKIEIVKNLNRVNDDTIPNSEKVKHMTVQEQEIFVNKEWEKIEEEFGIKQN